MENILKNKQQLAGKFLKASTTPLEDIESLSYPGQPKSRKGYKKGYESFFNIMSVLEDSDPHLDYKVGLIRSTMSLLAENLKVSSWLVTPKEGEFASTIIAMESPRMGKGGKLEEGAELVVAHWGKGFQSTIHGHGAGYLNETILSGKIRVNTYRIIDKKRRVAVPYGVEIVREGEFVSMYTKKSETTVEREVLVHNFEALESSHTLHFLPEHTRDGRDNQFSLVTFEDYYGIDSTAFEPITTEQAMYSRKGDVILVRSTNVPDYGDHYIVITGAPVMKAHGLRPQDHSIPALGNNSKFILDSYDDVLATKGVVLLRLKRSWLENFNSFHNLEQLP